MIYVKGSARAVVDAVLSGTRIEDIVASQRAAGSPWFDSYGNVARALRRRGHDTGPYINPDRPWADYEIAQFRAMVEAGLVADQIRRKLWRSVANLAAKHQDLFPDAEPLIFSPLKAKAPVAVADWAAHSWRATPELGRAEGGLG